MSPAAYVHMYIIYTYIYEHAYVYFMYIYIVCIHRVVGLPKRIKLRKYAKLNFLSYSTASFLFPLPLLTATPTLLTHVCNTHTSACLQVCWRKWNRFKHRRVRTRPRKESGNKKRVPCQIPYRPDAVEQSAYTHSQPQVWLLFKSINNCIFPGPWDARFDS